MRARLTLAAAGVAVAAALAPVPSASAVCIETWKAVTGQCSPCTTVGPAYSTLRDLGVPDIVQCLT